MDGNPDHLNWQLLQSIAEVQSASRAEWNRISRFWYDGRSDEFGEDVALWSMIFYATARRLSRHA